jgi:hypothetical protein
MLLAACGGSDNSSSSTITVTVTPAATTLSAGGMAAFTATVANTKNTAVTWKVNGIEGGNATYGTITASGTYDAPGSVSSTITETVTAVSAADPTITGSATVTLNPGTQTGSTSLSVSPSSVILTAGSQQTFVAQAGVSTADVVWTLNCKATSVTDCGTISTAGIYTAPLSPPPGGNVTVEATLKDGSSSPGYSTVVVQYSNATLTGRYAFSFAGENGTSPIAVLGTIQFDGAGNVVSGAEDLGSNSSATISSGTYHVNTDGRGTATLQTSNGSATWQFVVATHSILYASTSGATGTMSGELDLQNPTQFDIGVINGNFALMLACPQGSTPLAQAGTIVADGAGGISQGVQDRNASGTANAAVSVTGSFTAPSATGRGTITLTGAFGTESLIYYLLDSTHLRLLQQSPNSPATGEAVKQAAGPFALNNVQGKFALALNGWNGSGPASLGSQFRLDGTGSVTASVDTNANGNVQKDVSMTGTYAVADATSGRTTMNFTANGKTYQFVAYPAAGGDLYVVEVDSGVASAEAFAQTGFVINTGSLAGSFATTMSGVSFAAGGGFEAATGELIINGGGAVTGTLDIGLNGTLTADSTLTASYAVDSTGFVTVAFTSSATTLSSGTWTLYPIDAQRFLLVEVDSNRVLTGISEVHN